VSNAQESLIARRYAKAFVALAADQKKLSEVSKDIDSLESLMTDEGFDGFLKNRSLDRTSQMNVMQAISSKMKLNPLTANYIGTIVENGRVALLPNILDMTQQFLAEYQGEVRATVTSARPLTEEQVAKVKKALKTATGHDIEITLRQDKDLIGGLTIQVGSLLIDQSVKTRLDRLERALKSDTPAKEAKALRDAA